MISCKIGNVLDVKSGIIVHGCNCQGVMGSGIAREIKERFPIVFETYHSRPLRMGEIIPVQLSETKWIVNAMTQYGFGHGKRQVDYDAVANVFEKVVELAKTLPVQLPILFPKFYVIFHQLLYAFFQVYRYYLFVFLTNYLQQLYEYYQVLFH